MPTSGTDALDSIQVPARTPGIHERREGRDEVFDRDSHRESDQGTGRGRASRQGLSYTPHTMLRGSLHARRPGQVRRLLGPVVLLVVAILLLGGSQPRHLHADQSPGFYNEAHVLVTLAAFTGDAPLPGPVTSAWIAPIAGEAPAPAAPGAVAARHGHTDSRAPPLL